MYWMPVKRVSFLLKALGTQFKINWQQNSKMIFLSKMNAVNFTTRNLIENLIFNIMD